MYSFMGGGLFCAGVGNVLLIVSTATDYWMQYRHSSNYMHQGLWRYCTLSKCFIQTDGIAYWDATKAFMILSLLACFFGIIVGIMAFIHSSYFVRFDKTFTAGTLFFVSCFFVLLAMAIYTGATVNYYGRRYTSWRFSWSYIIGWVAVMLMFFSGIFYMCAYRMHECPRSTNSR
ncbi:lens intrinsic membrane protein 2.1 [Paramormyrops kingsleyae]|uniref:lens intrinsic membrane protein 2.1 n=1 Tax=Paramormyrops kingsleyae TaxID=1676925 RepID=UPI000CD5EF45|nr:lens fiber membrane intrinsic protein-like [Paramormyrops kingsleyae]